MDRRRGGCESPPFYFPEISSVTVALESETVVVLTTGSGQRHRRPAATNTPISSHKTMAIHAVLTALSETLGNRIWGFRGAGKGGDVDE